MAVKSFNAYQLPIETIKDSSPLGWQEDAPCSQTDPEAFFPEQGMSTQEAKKVCRACDVAQVCLEYALENNLRFGVWGGMSEGQRRKLAKALAEEPDSNLLPE